MSVWFSGERLQAWRECVGILADYYGDFACSH